MRVEGMCLCATRSFKHNAGSLRCRLAAKYRGEKGKYEEEEKREKRRQRAAETGRGFCAGALRGGRSSSWLAAAELVHADSGTSSKVEHEAWSCVEDAAAAACTRINLCCLLP